MIFLIVCGYSILTSSIGLNTERCHFLTVCRVLCVTTAYEWTRSGRGWRRFLPSTLSNEQDVFVSFLADRTAVRSMTGYWHDTVVCLSVYNTVHCGAVGRWRGWKLYRRVPILPSRAFPIHFFCCRVYRLVIKTQRILPLAALGEKADRKRWSDKTVAVSKADFSLKPK